MRPRDLIWILASGVIVAVTLWFGWKTWTEVQEGTPPAPEAGAPGAPGRAERDPAKGVRVETEAPLPVERPVADPVQGIVVGPDGRPVAGAQVTLLEIVRPEPILQLRPLQALHTGDDGRFSFRTSRAPGRMLEVRARGMATLQIPLPADLPSVTLFLLRGFELSGFVRDGQGHPVPDCEVVVGPGQPGEFRGKGTRTDARGNFRFEALPPEVVAVTARDGWHTPATLTPVAVGGDKPLILTLDQPGLVVDLQVVQGSETQRRPVAGAEIRLYPASWNAALHVPTVATSGDDGRVTLRGLARGNYRILVSHAELATAERTVAIRPELSSLEIELGPKVAVAGRLVGPGAKAGIGLVLENELGETVRTRTEEQGRFALPQRVSPGVATFTVANGNLLFAKSDSPWLKIPIEEGAQLDLAVREGGTLRGVVQDESGAPVAGVAISQAYKRGGPVAVYEVRTMSDAGGRFVLQGVPAAKVELLFDKLGLARIETVVDGVAAGQERELAPIVLPRPGTITGQVRSGGKPVTGAWVFSSAMRTSHYDVTGPDGTFALRGVAPGTYLLKGRYSTLPIALARAPVQVAPGATVGPVVLEFQAARVLSGRVEDLEGQPVPEAMILATGNVGSVVYTDAQGAFQVEVPEGSLELHTYTAERDLRISRVVGPQENNVRIRMPLVPHGRLGARVLGLPGRRPVSFGILRIEPLDPLPPGDMDAVAQRRVPGRPVTMASGILSVSRFPAGRSRVTLHCPGYAPFEREVEVLPNAEADLRTILLEPGGRLEAMVRDPDGKPVANASLYVGNEADAYYMRGVTVQSDESGKVVVSGISARADRVVVMADGFASTEVRLALPGDLLRTSPLPIVLQRGATLKVEVKTAEGKPQTLGALLIFRDGVFLEQQNVSEDGRAEFRGLRPGRYRLMFPRDRESWQDVEVPAGVETVQATFQRK